MRPARYANSFHQTVYKIHTYFVCSKPSAALPGYHVTVCCAAATVSACNCSCVASLYLPQKTMIRLAHGERVLCNSTLLETVPCTSVKLRRYFHTHTHMHTHTHHTDPIHAHSIGVACTSTCPPFSIPSSASSATSPLYSGLPHLTPCTRGTFSCQNLRSPGTRLEARQPVGNNQTMCFDIRQGADVIFHLLQTHRALPSPNSISHAHHVSHALSDETLFAAQLFDSST